MSTDTLPFVVSPTLTAIAVNFKNPDTAFIADEVLPRVDVDGLTFKYDKYKIEEMFTVPDTNVGRKGQIPEVKSSAEQVDGSVTDHALKEVIPMLDIRQAEAARRAGNSKHDPEARAVEKLKHLMMLRREVRTAAVIQDASNYDAGRKITLTGTAKWTDYVNSDPIADIWTGRAATFIAKANVGVTSEPVMDVLRRHPKILQAVNRNDGGSGVAEIEEIAKLFKLKKILIGETELNTARPGQAVAMANVWGNAFTLLHVSQMAQALDGMPTFGFTPEWRRWSGSSMMAARYVDVNAGGAEGGVQVRVAECLGEHLSAPQTGYHITTPI